MKKILINLTFYQKDVKNIIEKIVKSIIKILSFIYLMKHQEIY